MSTHRTPLTLAATLAATALAAPPAAATFPGANGDIVLQRPKGDQFDLHVVSPVTGDSRRVASSPLIEEDASWSPDGRTIAFARSARGGYPTEIWTIAGDGTGLQQVTRYGSTSSAPAFSPDGERIAFFTLKDFPEPESPDDPPPPAELYSIRADGSAATRLTNDRTIQTDPTWSPDGATIAFIPWRPIREKGELFFDLGLGTIPAAGGATRTLVPFSARRDMVNASWSPDGRALVAEVSDGKQSDIAVVDASSGAITRLTRGPALETHPVFSPDGKLIVFTSDRHVNAKRRERLGPDFEVYVMNADGTGIRRVTRNRVADARPDWQPLPTGGAS